MQDRQEEQWGNDLNDDRWEGQADPNGRNTVQTPQPVNYGSQRRGSRGILLPAIAGGTQNAVQLALGRQIRPEIAFFDTSTLFIQRHIHLT